MDPTTQSLTVEQVESNLSPAELSSLVDLIQAQIEYHEREMARLECVRKRLKRKVKK